MGGRDGRVARARAHAQDLLGQLGRELRAARLQHGLSLTEVGRTAGMSCWQVGRIERGEVTAPSLAGLCALCSVVGLDLAFRPFPAGEPVRDAAHSELRSGFLAAIHPSIDRRLEVPLPIPGDLRAWDALLGVERRSVGTEFETRPRDIQAFQRRLALKARDGGVDAVILVLRDTRYNRRLLRLHADELAGAFPIPGRTALECLRAGRYPGGSAIILF